MPSALSAAHWLDCMLGLLLTTLELSAAASASEICLDGALTSSSVSFAAWRGDDSTNALVNRQETGKSRLAAQPKPCDRGFVGRFCYGAADSRSPRGFYDECRHYYVGKLRDQTDPVPTTKHDNSCPDDTKCSPAPAWGRAKPLIICVHEGSDPVGQQALALRRAVAALHGRRGTFINWMDVRQDLVQAGFDHTHYGVASAVVGPVSDQSQAVPAADEAGSSNSGSQHYRTDVTVGSLHWARAGVIGVPGRIPLGRRPSQPTHPDEPPAQRQRTAGQFTITRNDDPEPICSTTDDSEICALTSETPLEEDDVLHIDFSLMDDVNRVLDVLAFDLDSFSQGKAPPRS